MEKYNGWTNWDTWNSYNWITDDELMYRRACSLNRPGSSTGNYGRLYQECKR
jgi:hypothetical protein